jgi:hypothetical protein
MASLVCLFSLLVLLSCLRMQLSHQARRQQRQSTSPGARDVPHERYRSLRRCLPSKVTRRWPRTFAGDYDDVRSDARRETVDVRPSGW